MRYAHDMLSYVSKATSPEILLILYMLCSSVSVLSRMVNYVTDGVWRSWLGCSMTAEVCCAWSHQQDPNDALAFVASGETTSYGPFVTYKATTPRPFLNLT